MWRRKAPAAALLRDRRGSPALEFALVAPLMITLVMGGYDIATIVLTSRRLISAAQSAVEIGTELSVQPDQSTSLTPAQAYTASSAIYAYLPALATGQDTSVFSVTLSAVVFTVLPPGCTKGCAYAGATAWSVPMAGGQAVTRPCGPVAQVAAGVPVTLTNIPTAGITAPTSVLVADVSYVYTPMFADFITGPLTLRKTAFLPPRLGAAGQYVEYDVANAAADKQICPGFL